MTKGKVAITLSSFAVWDSTLFDLLHNRGFEVIFNTLGRKLNREETLKLCSGCVGMVVGTEMYDSDILEKLSGARVISRCGVGVDSIDLGVANRLGIKIFNTPEAPTLAVAELTVGLILNLLRKVTEMHNDIKNNKWKKLTGNLLYKKRMGIIGFGRIGKKVACLLMPFGCDIAYADPFAEDGLMKGLRRLSLEELLGWADIVSIHVSGSDRLLGETQLKTMKEGAWLINTSRGGVVDEDALYQALKEGHLSGVALDVFEREPYTGPLRGLNNVILTPHIGSYAREARIQMEKAAVENLLRGLEDKK